MTGVSRRLIAPCLLLLTMGNIASSQARKTPPEFYIDKGACPGECCTYREWTVQKTTVTYARPDLNSARVGNLKAGTKVLALTGEVHTIPSQFVVERAYEKYQPGDVLWVYTYIGEGHFKIWFKGKMYQEALGFSPYGGSLGERCEASVEYCWGKLDRKLRMRWWIKIKSKDGRIGWTNQGENFRGADACG